VTDSGQRADLSGISQLVALGRIVRAQGNVGGVRMIPFYQPPNRLDNLKGDGFFVHHDPAGDPSTAQLLHLTRHWYHKQFVILHFSEVRNIEDAERLKGMLVSVRQDSLWELAPGEFFADDLLGYAIFECETSEVVGHVADVEPGPAHDYLLVKREGMHFRVPFVNAIVREIDTAARTIRVNLPPGIDEI
jgi:16S rRNA processing protein RimM